MVFATFQNDIDIGNTAAETAARHPATLGLTCGLQSVPHVERRIDVRKT
jgi:hypothetical protein